MDGRPDLSQQGANSEQGRTCSFSLVFVSDRGQHIVHGRSRGGGAEHGDADAGAAWAVFLKRIEWLA